MCIGEIYCHYLRHWILEDDSSTGNSVHMHQNRMSVCWYFFCKCSRAVTHWHITRIGWNIACCKSKWLLTSLYKASNLRFWWQWISGLRGCRAVYLCRWFPTYLLLTEHQISYSWGKYSNLRIMEKFHIKWNLMVCNPVVLLALY
jgi:hypothetical protein